MKEHIIQIIIFMAIQAAIWTIGFCAGRAIKEIDPNLHEVNVDLPEEYQAISHDTICPTELYGVIVEDTLRITFNNCK